MNEVIKQLYERKSVRAFTDREITREDKRLILEAASMAPSAGNQQLYTILHITDQDLKDRLSETCDHQPFIAKAKMVLVFCADFQKWYDAFELAGCKPRKPEAGDLMLAECSDGSMEPWHRILLYRRHYGKLRDPQRTFWSSTLRFSGGDGSFWVPHQAAGREGEATKGGSGAFGP